MALTVEEKRRAAAFLYSLPGKRGIDIPGQTWDTINAVASGITQPLWGRAPTPHQLQHLYDVGAHTPEAIHAAFDGLPHPHAAGLRVGEFAKYAQAHKLYLEHHGGR